MRIVPEAEVLSWAIMSSASFNRYSACSTLEKMSFPPCADSSMPRWVRLNSEMPSWFSSCLIDCETAGCEIYNSSAAFVRLPHLATV